MVSYTKWPVYPLCLYLIVYRRINADTQFVLGTPSIYPERKTSMLASTKNPTIPQKNINNAKEEASSLNPVSLGSSMFTSSTRTRRGGSCLKDIYKTFLIYRTCMRRAPAKPVRACILRKWCLVSHVTFEAPLRTSHLTVFTLHTTHFTLHTSHCTLPTARFPLQTLHHTSHFTVHTSHFTVHTSHFTLHTSHFTVHTSHFTLHTSHFTLHTSHCTLHAPHFTLHPSHSTLHLIWALLTLSQLISSHLISSHMSSKLSWITSQYYY